MSRAQYQLNAVAAERTRHVGLGPEAGSPIFFIERTSYSEGQRPVDYEKLYYRGELIRFATRLSRRPRTRT
ncbi:UTRA domain-containing protein [Nitrosospira sp. Nsp18]|uniref:UTRA domain-containing protein n=1 Tax=Nitrosospira sp. Nsp18 TaxID=1855334 RepID=UPI00352603BE